MPSTFQREIHCVLGLPFDAIDETGAIKIIRNAIQNRQSCFLSTPNLNWIVASLNDPELRQSVMESDISVADGMPIIWAAKLLGIPLSKRVAGSGLFEALRYNPGNPVSVYFFGGPDGIAKKACEEINSQSGNLRCVGFDSPGFGSVESMSSDATIGQINASKADFLVVSLGAKKGQAWIMRNRQRLTVPVISHLGAVVNFVAGNVNRAPAWMQKTGLEWAWRIKEEPGLWTRYFRDGIQFLRLFFTHLIPHVVLTKSRFFWSNNGEGCSVTIIDSQNSTTLHLNGFLTFDHLEPLRENLSEKLKSGSDVTLDLTHANYIDSGFVGLMMIAKSNFHNNDKTLLIQNATSAVRRIFKYSCAEHLLHE